MERRINLRLQDVPGRFVRLDDTRLVFVGSHPSLPDRVFVNLRSDKGIDTLLTLSHDATAAIKALLTDPEAGEPGCTPEHKLNGWTSNGAFYWTCEVKDE
jgi:hypothetical protein